MKQPITVRNISNTPQNGTAATAAMTSKAISFADEGIWSLNVWFNAAFAATQSPQITIEVSNDTDADSFTVLSGANKVNAPHFFDNLDSTWKFFRIIYDPKGASAGEKNFDLIQNV